MRSAQPHEVPRDMRHELLKMNQELEQDYKKITDSS